MFEKFAEWSAWYSGDPDALASVYTSAPPPTTGWFSRLARWWWGTRPTPGQPITKLHVPAAADLATLSADLLLSQPPRLMAADTATTDRLAEHMDERTHATLREAAEIAAALGGVWLRVNWDSELSTRPWLDLVHPDAAVGQWRHGHLTGVTFWRTVAIDDKSVTRHLEEHTPGQISHGLYVGDRNVLGVRVPLTEHPTTAALARHLTSGDTIDTGIKPLITAAYIPNMRPARLWRHSPAAAMLGRPDIEGLEPLLDQLDERWSDWMREVRLAKARLLVPHSFLESAGRGKGATFDADAELLTAMNMGPAPDASALQLVQPNIRVRELSATTEAVLAQIVKSAGYSAQSFGGSEGSELTATEVNARNSRSALTRRKKVSYWAPGLAAIAQALLAIDKHVFGAAITPTRPRVEFPPIADPDALDVAQSLNLLRSARAASTRTLVATLHPDWDNAAVTAEAALIDQTATVPGPPVAQPPPEPLEGE
ncbi:phage portal protein [Actinomadura litoris]|uniref:phage portal protein n=1 Tax=Actinomadura litoris TaxID=2678616 RepID=UPI001FA79277|nr:phage portal protein [Actinomadura litoris]